MKDKIIDIEMARDLKIFEDLIKKIKYDPELELISRYYFEQIKDAPGNFIDKLNFFISVVEAELPKLCFDSDDYDYHENVVLGCLEQLGETCYSHYQKQSDIDTEIHLDDNISLATWQNAVTETLNKLKESIKNNNDVNITHYCEEAWYLSPLSCRIQKGSD